MTPAPVVPRPLPHTFHGDHPPRPGDEPAWLEHCIEQQLQAAYDEGAPLDLFGPWTASMRDAVETLWDSSELAWIAERDRAPLAVQDEADGEYADALGVVAALVRRNRVGLAA